MMTVYKQSNEVRDLTNSGLAMKNDLFMNMSVHNLPFGGNYFTLIVF